MSFTPDMEGNGIADEANQVVANFCLEQVIRTQGRLSACGPSCPGCGNEVQDAEDRMSWFDRTGRWILSLANRPQKPTTPLDADGYPLSKPNRNNRKRRR